MRTSASQLDAPKKGVLGLRSRKLIERLNEKGYNSIKKLGLLMNNDTTRFIVSEIAAVLLVIGIYLKRHDHFIVGQRLVRLGTIGVIIGVGLWILAGA